MNLSRRNLPNVVFGVVILGFAVVVVVMVEAIVVDVKNETVEEFIAVVGLVVDPVELLRLWSR